jgi:RNA polymerase sigma-70 factor (ECF subfamily)
MAVDTATTLDRDTVAELYRLHGPFLLHFLLKRTNGDVHLAEDIMQDTFFRAWRTPRLAHDSRHVRPWLVTVARNLIIDRYRKHSRRPLEVGEVDLSQVAQDGRTDERLVTTLTLADAMAKLPKNRQEVVVHMYVHGHSTTETSGLLGIPEGTVKSRAHYALRDLRSHLDRAELSRVA